MDLKPYKDAVEKRQNEAMQVASQIDELMQADKLEDALALQPTLDEAEAKVQEAQKLYDSMTKVSERGEPVAAKFVPVSDEPDRQLEEPKPDEKVKTRSEFDAMTAKDRMEFVKAGGKVVPDKE